jgi:RNA recognition motif-containing protein
MSARELKKQRKKQQRALVTGPTFIIGIRRHYEACFKVMVRNLPPTVTSAQLQLFLSKHGNVSSAEVLRYKKTKRSQGIGLVTISTLHANKQDALDALNALSLDGYDLEVVFVKEGRRRRCPGSIETL